MYTNIEPQSKILRAASTLTYTGTRTSYITLLKNSLIFSNSSTRSYLGAPQLLRMFKAAPKFMDIVTGVNNVTLNHNLGVIPSMIFVQDINGTANNKVYHSGFSGGINGFSGDLSSTAIPATGTNISATTTSINCSALSLTADCIAYLFADDPSTNGIIRCSTFTTDATGNAIVNIGWEPQFVLIKRLNATDNYILLDSIRAWSVSGVTLEGDYSLANWLNVAGSTSENAITSTPTALGFNFKGGASSTYAFMAIRRSNKPPTSAPQVFNIITRTGIGSPVTVSGAGFPPDSIFSQARNPANGNIIFDRIRGAAQILRTSVTNPEYNSAPNSLTAFTNDGYSAGADSTMFSCNNSGDTYAQWIFKRAAGVFDVVCWNSISSSNQRIQHNLLAVPELIIQKQRNSAEGWRVYVPLAIGGGISNQLRIDTTAGISANTNVWGTSVPSTTDYGFDSGTNYASATVVSYLFATKAGISKIGAFTGNGTSLTINCGFAAGARFVLIKRTDSAGNWYVWDTSRGIIAANDPHLNLNDTNAEVTTDDSIDPDASGFIVNQVAATNVNVTSATYIFLAMA